MLLRVTPLSPFGRKVRMAISRLGLWDRIESIKADPMDPADPLRSDNPLGKIPTLVTDDGKPVFDSRVILEYLDHVAGGGKIIPTAWPARIEALTLQAMCDGVMDACILIVYEARHRPEALRHEPWLDYQRGKVVRGLTAFARQPPDAARFDVGTVTAACMLGYSYCVINFVACLVETCGRSMGSAAASGRWRPLLRNGASRWSLGRGAASGAAAPRGR